MSTHGFHPHKGKKLQPRVDRTVDDLCAITFDHGEAHISLFGLTLEEVTQFGEAVVEAAWRLHGKEVAKEQDEVRQVTPV